MVMSKQVWFTLGIVVGGLAYQIGLWVGGWIA